MHSLVYGLGESTVARPRTLIAAQGKVWLWPGVALTSKRGDQTVAASAETIRFWITRLRGPDALHTEAVHCVARAADCLTRGDEKAAQRALDAIGLFQLSPDGAVLMHCVAKRMGIEALDLPLRSGLRCWSAGDIAAQVPFFEKASDCAAPLAKFVPFDPLKHPRWPEGAPESQGGRFAPGDETDAAIIQTGFGGKGKPGWRRKRRPTRVRPDEKDHRHIFGRESGKHGLEGESGDHHDSGSDNEQWLVPRNAPDPDKRYAAVKDIARSIQDAIAASNLARVDFLVQRTAATAWLMAGATYYYHQLRANFDPPKTLAELQAAAHHPALGYDVHHIVELDQGMEDGFSESQLEGEENLVLAPEMKHRQLSAWYSKPNDEFDGLSPRAYLKGKSWQEKYDLGIKKLIDFGILKP
jgi:hypothetical protein